MSSRSIRRQRLLAAGIIAVFVVATVTVFSIAWMSEGAGKPTDANAGSTSDGTLKPASGRIAFFSDRDGDDEIYVMNADGSNVVQLTHNDSHDLGPEWSPDGKRIAFTSDRDNDPEVYNIYIMNADGTDVERLTTGYRKSYLAWSPDGDRIAFNSRNEIYVMNVESKETVQLTDKRSEYGPSVFFSDRDNDGHREAYIRNSDGTVERFTEFESVNWTAKNCCVSWSPNGERIVFESGRDGDFEIYTMNADGTDVVQLTNTNRWVDDSYPSWSPDGDRIAFVSRDDDSDGDIYVMNADGSAVEKLTDNNSIHLDPVWSPNGDRIAFVCHRPKITDRYFTEIYVMNADGSGVVRLGEGYGPAWSP